MLFKNTIVGLTLLLSSLMINGMGTVLDTSFASPLTGQSDKIACTGQATTPNARRVSIYFPPGYSDVGNTQRYPVFYFMPGQATGAITFSAAAQNFFNYLISTQQVPPFIAVLPDPNWPINARATGVVADCYHSRFYTSPVFGGGGGPNTVTGVGDFEGYFNTELIPFIDSSYRTLPNPQNRAVFSFSGSGVSAFVYVAKFPQNFGYYILEVPLPYEMLLPDYQLSPVAISRVQDEIPFVGPNAGRITPSNGSFTQQLFNQAVLFSPNIARAFRVDLPILVDANYFPIYDSNGQLQLDPVVYAQWQAENPTGPAILTPSVIEYMNKAYCKINCSTMDLNVGAFVQGLFSEQLVEQNVNHEFLVGVFPHGLQSTIRKSDLISFANFIAKQGFFTDDIRIKFIGNWDVNLNGNASFTITDMHYVGVETNTTNVSQTDVTFNLNDASTLTIGTDANPGGALQVGDNYSKVQLINDPSLADNVVNFTLNINGATAQCVVGKQGFLGLGVGVEGKAPAQPNFWSVNSLINLKKCTINLAAGALKHNRIYDGFSPEASLFAVADNDESSFTLTITNGALFGGGNMVLVNDSRALMPQVRNAAGTPIINFLETERDVLLEGSINSFGSPVNIIYKGAIEPISYHNSYQVGMLASTPMLASLVNSSLKGQGFFDRIKTRNYDASQLAYANCNFDNSSIGLVIDDQINRIALGSITLNPNCGGVLPCNKGATPIVLTQPANTVAVNC